MKKEILEDRLDQLTNEDRKLILLKLKDLISNISDSNTSEKPKRLVAYVEAESPFEPDKVEAFLKKRLPNYMVPSTIHTVSKMPLLPNGKVDKKSLKPEPSENVKKAAPTKINATSNSELESQLINIWEDVLNFSPVLPEDNFFEIGGDSILSIQIIAKARKLGIQLTANQLFEYQTIRELSKLVIPKQKNDSIEKQLIGIWEDVLNVKPIRTDDNFFEIGGDSILSIQIIAKARKIGIKLSANQLFEHQTIAELNPFLENNNSVNSTISITEGEVALTPIQHWFFETHKAAPHFWNQIVEVKNISSGISPKDIETIVTKLVSHHDVLRSSFRKINDKWQAFILKTDAIQPYHEINLISLQNETSQNIEIEQNIKTIQQTLSLSEGSLFKILYFNCGKTQKDKVYIIAHHLVIDFVSWNIIFQDMEAALKLIKKNKDIYFGKKTDSIKKWGDYLDALINSGNILNELPFWSSQRNDLKQLPIDFEVSSNIYAENSINNYTVIIDKNSTSTLLFKANELYNTKIEDLLITTLLKTISEWADMDYLCLGLERQGRALEDNSIDISNTVGWFTSYFPIMLENNPVHDIGEKIKSVKEQLNGVPNNGIGYGILKYLSNKNKTDLDINPKVVFNYLGNSNESLDNSKIDFQFQQIQARSEWSERTYQLELNTFVKNGKLNINWSYTYNLFKETTFLKLAKTYETNLNELINYCEQKENGDYTPSDFPESGLNQEDLDNLINLL